MNLLKDRFLEATNDWSIKHGKKFNFSALGRYCNASKQAIQGWKNGNTKKIDDLSVLMKAAEYLDVDFNWLQTGQGKKDAHLQRIAKNLNAVVGDNFSSLTNHDYRNVPLIANVSAGNWEDIFDEYPVGYGEDNALCTVKCSEHTVAFKVNGDSMTSELGDTFPSGTVIFVDPLAEARGGSYIIAKLKNDTQATFKKLIIDGSRKYLQPLNKALPPLLEEFEVLGVVVEAKISFV